MPVDLAVFWSVCLLAFPAKATRVQLAGSVFMELGFMELGKFTNRQNAKSYAVSAGSSEDGSD